MMNWVMNNSNVLAWALFLSLGNSYLCGATGMV